MDKESNEQRKAEAAAIEKESTDKTGLRSEVVTLYSGGEYWLYRFKKYTDIRLVCALLKSRSLFSAVSLSFAFTKTGSH
jgi:Peptidase S46